MTPEVEAALLVADECAADRVAEKRDTAAVLCQCPDCLADDAMSALAAEVRRLNGIIDAAAAQMVERMQTPALFPQTCDTCKHQAIPVDILGCPVEAACKRTGEVYVWPMTPCRVLGNRCGAWEAR